MLSEQMNKIIIPLRSAVLCREKPFLSTFLDIVTVFDTTTDFALIWHNTAVFSSKSSSNQRCNYYSVMTINSIMTLIDLPF